MDLSGKFLIPGLWDVHVHLCTAGENALPLFIANGITSVRDMGGDFELLMQWKREIEQGKRIGPRIKTPGPILESSANVERLKRESTFEPVDRFRLGLADPASAEGVVARLAGLGVDFIKIRTVASMETYQAITAAAHKYHLSVAGHQVASPEAMLQAGQQSIEHGFFPPLIERTAEQRRALFRKLVTNGTAIVPTLVLTGDAFQLPPERIKAIVQDAKGTLDFRRQYVSGYLITVWMAQVAKQKTYPPELQALLRESSRDLREMHQSGVRIMPGTDVAGLLIWPGFSLHEELRLLVEQVGMTRMEALLSATRAPAEFLGLAQDWGTIQEGKIADLVLLDRDPLENIQNTRSIAAVLFGGRLFSKSDIQKMLAECAARAQQEAGQVPR
jgi:imidazolonepropionase-like amidohydrolase